MSTIYSKSFLDNTNEYRLRGSAVAQLSLKSAGLKHILCRELRHSIILIEADSLLATLLPEFRIVRQGFGEKNVAGMDNSHRSADVCACETITMLRLERKVESDVAL